jgi:hypothetical protein
MKDFHGSNRALDLQLKTDHDGITLPRIPVIGIIGLRD